MYLTNEKLQELLVKPGYISGVDFELADQRAKAQGKDIQDVLVESDLIEDDQLGRLIAYDNDFVFLDLKREKIDENILHFIPEAVARSKGVIIFGSDGEKLKVAMVDPQDLETQRLVYKKTGQEMVIFYITNNNLQKALEFYKGSIKMEFDKIIAVLKNPLSDKEQYDASIVKMVDTLLEWGHQSQASDIHIEPYIDKIMVRFRIDGILHDVLNLPKDLTDLILTRIKIMAKMRTDEHRAAQDGKLRLQLKDEIVDVRVSIVPVAEGENVVLRLLSAKNRQFSLTSLGFSDNDLQKIKDVMKHPHGMILSTGPTGSGKTTTLYAILKILNKREVNIATIEDPVEYEIEGVSQIQVNVKTNLTFANGLRAIVRQDPNIIMVGEIRDSETADIAVNSALTGHLVLSTLHTNDAATALPRLLDMGVEPFLVSSTINAIIGQRLVRQICPKCRASYKLEAPDIELIERHPEIKNILLPKKGKSLKDLRLYKGAGCKVCGQTGYSGRLGIFEVLMMSDEIKSLILKRASSGEIVKAACREGMTTMLQDGVKKVMMGLTTLSEILRVTKE